MGTFEPFDAAAATAALADGVLRKPFVADELLRKVEQLLGPVRRAAPAPDRGSAAPREPTLRRRAIRRPTGRGEETRPHPRRRPPTRRRLRGRRPALSDADVDRIARRVLELGGEAVLERVARELLRPPARRGDPERE